LLSEIARQETALQAQRRRGGALQADTVAVAEATSEELRGKAAELHAALAEAEEEGSKLSEEHRKAEADQVPMREWLRHVEGQLQEARSENVTFSRKLAAASRRLAEMQREEQAAQPLRQAGWDIQQICWLQEHERGSFARKAALNEEIAAQRHRRKVLITEAGQRRSEAAAQERLQEQCKRQQRIGMRAENSAAGPATGSRGKPQSLEQQNQQRSVLVSVHPGVDSRATPRPHSARDSAWADSARGTSTITPRPRSPQVIAGPDSGRQTGNEAIPSSGRLNARLENLLSPRTPPGHRGQQRQQVHQPTMHCSQHQQQRQQQQPQHPHLQHEQQQRQWPEEVLSEPGSPFALASATASKVERTPFVAAHAVDDFDEAQQPHAFNASDSEAEEDNALGYWEALGGE